MKIIHPKLESTRTKNWFAILPVRIGRETRWLEVVEVKQEWKDLITPSGEPEPGWYNKEFIN